MKNIFLIHGWNYTNYSKFGGLDAWANRDNFVKELSKYYNVIKLNLPGFCGQSEPNKTWDLDDFANFFEYFVSKSGLNPDLVLGYSFGGAVATKWKLKYKNNAKIILVSPAITRAYEERVETKYLSMVKNFVPNFISNIVRHYYLKYIVKNSFYSQGTPFLRYSYLNIVKIDLANEVVNIPSDQILIIFGENDTATPVAVFKNRISKKEILANIMVIPKGGHDIANSHYHDIVQYIKENN